MDQNRSSLCDFDFCNGTLDSNITIELVPSVLRDLQLTFSFNDSHPVPDPANESANQSRLVTVSDTLTLGVSLLEALVTALVLGVIIAGTVVGNILVILSVFTYRPLRNVQNMFIVSLAVADITVAVLVMPLNVAYSIMGRWVFGLPLCEMWLTCDVLCCTASILNLCAIALDRYWAIHDPINYARKRTLKRVLLMILLVWIISTLISAPPLIGWNDWPENFTEATPCMLTEERGYVIYSSSGSFYIPLVIMTIVYLKIFQVARRRFRVKAKAAEKLKKENCQAVQLKTLKPVPPPAPPPVEDKKNDDESQSATVALISSTNKVMEAKAFTDFQDEPSSWSTTGEDGNQNNTADTKTVNQYLESKQKISLSKERRAARVLGIVMGVFVLCWLPFFLMYVILPFCGSCYISQRMVNFITWLGYVNSALNPIIYTIFNGDFRKAFEKLLCRRRVSYR